MFHRASAVAVLAMAASVAACGGERQQPAEAPSGQPAEAASAEPAAAPDAPASHTPAAAAPLAAGTPPASFALCRTCHAVEAGKNGIGPTLAGIVGSKAGEVAGYQFSPALAQSGIVWDRATLDQWLSGPPRMVPGTKMVMSVPDPARRKEIIDYLETLK